jgi:hypothetical protein
LGSDTGQVHDVGRPKAWMVVYKNETGEPKSANESKTDFGDEKLNVSTVNCSHFSERSVDTCVPANLSNLLTMKQ